ncbi:MAG: hypothetical protein DMC60_12890 [Verrucomicrobia bacterium]|nr:MAG: hypothetical protein DMC60_12890 [Verrucomicrobiota bacterium]
MKRRFYLGALTLGLATGALILTSCSTPETRISDHPDLYQSLSARDRALVSQSQIRPGMLRNAVWLAWGSPDRKIIANMRGHPTETWIYVYYATYPYYPYYGPYGPYGPGLGYSLGYTTVGVATGTTHHHGGCNFVFFGDPFYDPFFYSTPLSIPYPGKVVTFSSGRVMSFQYLAPN